MAVLTDTKARHIKPDDKPIPHGGVTGLTLHPSNTKGHGKWVLRFVSPMTGRRRNAGLGSYPAVGVAEAAKRALSMRELLNNGEDPLEAKATEKNGSDAVPTFEVAARTLHQELLPSWKNVKHGQQWINTLAEYAFPVLGSRVLNDIEPRHVADVLRPIWLSKAETAGRLKQRLHAVMAWGWAHGFCASNPADVVGHLLPQQPSKTIRTQHQPAMPWRCVPEFVATHLLNRSRYDVTRTMLHFLILTACRSIEARGMVWSEVSLESGVWTIPPERMKAAQQHRIPLSAPALEILKGQAGLHSTLVFPSPRAETVLSDMVLTAFLRRVGALSDTPGRIATAHGFRSSFRDWCSEQGVSRDLAERSLAHTLTNRVEAAYHREADPRN